MKLANLLRKNTPWTSRPAHRTYAVERKPVPVLNSARRQVFLSPNVPQICLQQITSELRKYGCYWARLRSLDTGDIIDNNVNDGPQVVQILPNDKAFMTRNCGDWQKVG